MRLKKNLPEPTADKPYIQVEFIWERYSQTYDNSNTRKNVMRQFSAYEVFLKESYIKRNPTDGDERFFIKKDWHDYSVCAAERYWRTTKYKSATISGLVSTLTNVINFATERGLTSVSNLICPKVVIHKDPAISKAYSDEEMVSIRKIIKKGYDRISELVLNYERKHVGLDPRGRTRKGESSPWKNWENMVWFFENVIDCQPMPIIKESKDIHRPVGLSSFHASANLYHGGIKNVWKKLGAPSKIDSEILMPLVAKLTLETGLNTNSVLNLKRDCLKKHPLFKTPYIRYYKERSTGEKDLHIALFDEENGADLELTYKQSEIIRRTLDLILELTEPLVSLASVEDKEYLLLVQSRHHGNDGTSAVKRIKRNDLNRWSKSVRTGSNENDVGEIIEGFNLGRFRATKITQMVQEGHDFFRIQAVAGHSHLRTTMSYVGMNKIVPLAEYNIEKTLNQIRENSQEFIQNPKPFAKSDSLGKPGFIYKGVLADCKNVFDPPKAVRQMKNYEQGQGCSYWNMCLFCPNVIITKRHLPVLMSYVKSINVSRETGNLLQIPNGTYYEKVSEVINGIFNEFTEDDILWADAVAESTEHYIDGQTFRGVANDGNCTT